ncbi:hypothetical protein HR12_43445 [Microbacterium sp. SUBG005]|nr:hypothetical protein HR12_43445 [Microbacterium sp. SUBG005]
MVEADELTGRVQVIAPRQALLVLGVEEELVREAEGSTTRTESPMPFVKPFGSRRTSQPSSV